MQKVAREVSDQRTILKNCFDTIRNEALRLTSYHWEGKGAEAYSEIMGLLSNESSSSSPVNAGYVLETLMTYSTQLNETAAEYGAIENRALDRSEFLRADVFDI